MYCDVVVFLLERIKKSGRSPGKWLYSRWLPELFNFHQFKKLLLLCLRFIRDLYFWGTRLVHYYVFNLFVPEKNNSVPDAGAGTAMALGSEISS